MQYRLHLDKEYSDPELQAIVTNLKSQYKIALRYDFFTVEKPWKVMSGISALVSTITCIAELFASNLTTEITQSALLAVAFINLGLAFTFVSLMTDSYIKLSKSGIKSIEYSKDALRWTDTEPKPDQTHYSDGKQIQSVLDLPSSFITALSKLSKLQAIRAHELHQTRQMLRIQPTVPTPKALPDHAGPGSLSLANAHQGWVVATANLIAKITYPDGEVIALPPELVSFVPLDNWDPELGFIEDAIEVSDDICINALYQASQKGL